MWYSSSPKPTNMMGYRAMETNVFGESMLALTTNQERGHDDRQACDAG